MRRTPGVARVGGVAVMVVGGGACGSRKKLTERRERVEGRLEESAKRERLTTMDSTEWRNREVTVWRYRFSPPDSGGQTHLVSLEKVKSKEAGGGVTHRREEESGMSCTVRDSTRATEEMVRTKNEVGLMYPGGGVMMAMGVVAMGVALLLKIFRRGE